jgi:hypothetical protein
MPVDFYDTSANAIDYAAGFCKQFNYKRVDLLKSFYDTLYDEVIMSMEYGSRSQPAGMGALPVAKEYRCCRGGDNKRTSPDACHSAANKK